MPKTIKPVTPKMPTQTSFPKQHTSESNPGTFAAKVAKGVTKMDEPTSTSEINPNAMLQVKTPKQPRTPRSVLKTDGF